MLIRDAIYGLIDDQGLQRLIRTELSEREKLRKAEGDCIECGCHLPNHWGGCSVTQTRRAYDMIEYDILAAETPMQLAEAVRLHIADGWELVGGVAVSEHTDRWENERKGYSESALNATWAQAIIRRTVDSRGEPHG